MRTRCVCWGVAALVLLSGRGMAQPPASASPSDGVDMTIIVPEVLVRCKPTLDYYPTIKLKQGQRVRVMGESKDQPGWSIIKPPLGSFSWIQAKYVEQVDARNGYVKAPNNASVSVMPGSSEVELPSLKVVSASVPSGCVLVILGKPFPWEGEKWLQILPTPTEVRYIPSAAVKPPAPPVAVATGFPTTIGSDLIARADQAYRSGNLELAKQLYRQAADKSPEPQKSYALNRLATLTANGAAPVSTNHSNWQPVGQQTAPPPQGNRPSVPNPAQTTSNYTVPEAPMTALMSFLPPQWSNWGYLRRASFDRDGQPVYVLEDRSGKPLTPLTYVVEKPGGRSLAPMVGRLVCLYGPIKYQSSVIPRIQYMVATHFATP